MCVENAEGGAEANAQYGYANDGNQDENARNVPTHHETVDMSKKKGQRPKHTKHQTTKRPNDQTTKHVIGWIQRQLFQTTNQEGYPTMYP